MAGIKDKTALNNLIIELATANDWLSRDNLSEITGKPVKTLIVYLEKDLINFIDTKDVIELVNRNTGKGKTIIKKYNFKSGLDNLLSLFEYLETKKCQKKLMETDYYKSFIPYIEKKSKEAFCFTDSDYKMFEYPMLKEFYDVGIKYSPSFVYVLLKIKSDKSGFFEKTSAFPAYISLYYVLYGVLFYDKIDGIIDDEDFSKFQILVQSLDIPSLLLQKVKPD